MTASPAFTPPIRGAVRRLWPYEAGLARDHLMRLDPESRRLRFNGVVSDAAIDEHVRRLTRDGAVMIGYVIDGAARGLGELLPFDGVASSRAEAAFSVESGFRQHGVGRVLAQRIVSAARNRRLDRLHMTCARDNTGMIGVARGLTGKLLFEESDVRAILAIPPPTLLSLALEIFDDVAAGLAVVHQALTRPPRAAAGATC